MRIAVAGLGSSGSYLLHLLTRSGFDAFGFDPKREGYYIPCGYAANRHSMTDLLSWTKLDFSSYIESKAEEVIFSGTSQREIRFRSRGMVTFDKNKLEADLLKECRWSRTAVKGQYDLLVDATGVSRRYLPKVEDYRMHTVEYVTGIEEKKEFQFRYFSHGSGYFWIFPRGDKYHVGAGSDSVTMIKDSLSPYTPEKVVSRDIRLKPLMHSISDGNVIGIGEAIGTVSPITGEGIVPSMKSAFLLFTAITRSNDLDTIKENYASLIKKEFSRYYTLYDLLRSIQNNTLQKRKAIAYIRASRKDLREFGIDFKISRVLREFL
ncbi:MAG: NAD(P)/FAD-dependent oxidoreductase [Candidatus Thermoplasmatota archaeon]|nr:NAD(P)/FAD-dependent oxidoreductase [Candidatus Thermoplasmatota archaeon]